jgi:sugar O-acyltransferase (sialic acid O-acetyltransferase NeuD family)
VGRLVVWGTGGHARVVLDAALGTCAFETIAFVDDDPLKADDLFCGCSVVGTPDRLTGLQDHQFAIAIGDNRVRASCFERALSAGLSAATLIHTRVTVAASATIGAGTVVMAGAVVNPSARIGRNCIINTGAIVEHDCVVGDHAHISPGAILGGNVTVGAFAHVGIGAVVLPGTVVGHSATVGAGSVVLKAVPPGTTVAGIPARTLHPK